MNKVKRRIQELKRGVRQRQWKLIEELGRKTGLSLQELLEKRYVKELKR